MSTMRVLLSTMAFAVGGAAAGCGIAYLFSFYGGPENAGTMRGVAALIAIITIPLGLIVGVASGIALGIFWDVSVRKRDARRSPDAHRAGLLVDVPLPAKIGLYGGLVFCTFHFVYSVTTVAILIYGEMPDRWALVRWDVFVSGGLALSGVTANSAMLSGKRIAWVLCWFFFAFGIMWIGTGFFSLWQISVSTNAYFVFGKMLKRLLFMALLFAPYVVIATAPRKTPRGEVL